MRIPTKFLLSQEKPTANKLIEKKGASPKVADDTAAYIIPFN